ncbi:MAG: GGDEF domain-containing protein [Deltaproteobacteria bacterium HGW-Deltaproteobacteria-10]|nr:MAG: GGDEF domain-containing protein [Deltaproteobacteria bacterium HGW-Deltaproteobacteria-10]
MKKYLFSLLTILFVILIAVLEYWSGARIEFSIIYIVPVLMAATISKSFGVFISLASVTLAMLADYLLARQYQDFVYYLWDFASHSAIFLLVTVLRSNLIAARLQEHELARKDPLTNAYNGRAFKEIAETEINRAIRYKRPLTMAYIDVDNFKTVNDTLGHGEGDLLLRAIVAEIVKRLRKSDIIARLGGDEFAILLPETGQESALSAISQIQSSLMEEAHKRNWPVTFSIGVLTIIDKQPTVNQMIEAADTLMYEVKQGGKNAVRSGFYRETGRD